MSQPHGLLADVVRFSWVDGPGNRFAVFFQGCNLDCLACHNPHTMPLQHAAGPRGHRRRARRRGAPARTVPLRRHRRPAARRRCRPPFVARAGSPRCATTPPPPRLTRYVDSNGCADDAAWDLLLPDTDGVMLDLKALDLGRAPASSPGRRNTSVLRSLDRLAAAAKLVEVRLLVVPGHNDSADGLRRTGAYLAEHAPGVPVRVIGFRPHGVRAAARSIPEASAEQRAAYGAWVARRPRYRRRHGHLAERQRQAQPCRSSTQRTISGSTTSSPSRFTTTGS